MKIRSAEVEDARQIAEIHVRTWQTAYPGIVPAEYLSSLSIEKYEAMWHDCIAKQMPQLLVAAEPNGLLGWVAFGASRDKGAGPDIAEIWAFYVSASYWNRGVGRQLWLAAQTQMRSHGFKSVGLWAFPENVRAKTFYQSVGFKVQPSSSKKFTLGGAKLNEVRYVRPIDA